MKPPDWRTAVCGTALADPKFDTQRESDLRARPGPTALKFASSRAIRGNSAQV